MGGRWKVYGFQTDIYIPAVSYDKIPVWPHSTGSRYRQFLNQEFTRGDKAMRKDPDLLLPAWQFPAFLNPTWLLSPTPPTSCDRRKGDFTALFGNRKEPGAFLLHRNLGLHHRGSMWPNLLFISSTPCFLLRKRLRLRTHGRLYKHVLTYQL